jgi:thiol:disulfide interchange protein DsbD
MQLFVIENTSSGMKGYILKLSVYIISIILAVFALAATCAATQSLFQPPGELVETEAKLSLSRFHAGSGGYLAVRAEIADGWHINSNEPLDKYLIPTILEVHAPEGIEVEGILYPEPDLVKLEISESDMSLYHGTVLFGAYIKISNGVAPGSYTIRAILKYQGCNNLTCMEPASDIASIDLVVGTNEEMAEIQHEEIFGSPPFVDGSGQPARPGSGTGAQGGLGDMIQSRGLLLALVFIFIGGLALNLTPCIYPLIPITISYFGGQAGGKASRTLLLAVLYVLGMSITYSVLGTAAAMTGSLFGSALQNPWVVAFIVAVMIGLATSMFGLWEFRLPSFLTRGTGTAKQGYLGAVFMGLTVGIVAAPCIGPFVLGLLTYVGRIGNPVLGFLMFFTLAWGMGTPLLVLGTVSGSISHLPRSGDWMVWVRKIFGFILLAMGLYFARHILGDKITGYGYVAIALIAGIYLGWIDRTPAMSAGFKRLKWIIGIAGIAVAALLLIAPGGPLRTERPVPGIAWQAFSENLLAEATQKGSPVLIDFMADWCIPCHELDHKTFSVAEVIALSEKTVPLQVDLTSIGKSESDIKKRFDVRGVPTIIFIDASGKERPELRVTGFVDAEEFEKRLRELLE